MEVEVEVEFTWKGLFQRRLVLAARHCDRVHGLLFGAIEIVDANVRNWRRHKGPFTEEAQRALEGASAELGLALASMGAARHLALRGGAPCLSAPFDSVDDLAGDPGVCCALERLEKAAGIATRVHDGLEGARGHLRAAAPPSGPGRVGGGVEGGDSTAPWEQSPCFAEQLNGAMELGEAMLKAGKLVKETAGARSAALNEFSSLPDSQH